MPNPMIHLAIAYRLCEHFDFRENGLFYLGSIAPDAIHMRERGGRPEKQAAHFRQSDEINLDALKDFTSCLSLQPGLSAFADGYASHVLADKLWSEWIARPIHAKLPSDLSPGEHRKFYYREVDSLEIFLYNKVKWRARVCRLLKDTEAPDAVDILSSQEIGLWRDRVLRWPEENQDKGFYNPTQYTRDVLLSFIDRAANEMADTIFSWKPK